MWYANREILSRDFKPNYRRGEKNYKDDQQVFSLFMGSLIRLLAKETYRKREASMHWISFETEDDDRKPHPYYPERFSRSSCGSWRELEAELWIAYLERVEYGELGEHFDRYLDDEIGEDEYTAIVRVSLENAIEDGIRTSTDRRNVWKDIARGDPRPPRSACSWNISPRSTGESQKRYQRKIRQELRENGEEIPEEADSNTLMLGRKVMEIITLTLAFQPDSNIVVADGIAYLDGEPISA